MERSIRGQIRNVRVGHRGAAFVNKRDDDAGVTVGIISRRVIDGQATRGHSGRQYQFCYHVLLPNGANLPRSEAE